MNTKEEIVELVKDVVGNDLTAYGVTQSNIVSIILKAIGKFQSKVIVKSEGFRIPKSIEDDILFAVWKGLVTALEKYDPTYIPRKNNPSRKARAMSITTFIYYKVEKSLFDCWRKALSHHKLPESWYELLIPAPYYRLEEREMRQERSRRISTLRKILQKMNRKDLMLTVSLLLLGMSVSDIARIMKKDRKQVYRWLDQIDLIIRMNNNLERIR